MKISTAETLQTVAVACATVSDRLNDVQDGSPYTLRQITLPGGKGGFRFTMTVVVNGETTELTVRTINPKED